MAVSLYKLKKEKELMADIRNYIRKNREEEVLNEINSTLDRLSLEGFQVEFGNIGEKTTYAMIYNENHSLEYVGYTFVKNMRYYNENTGKLKALTQALARKETLNQ